MFWLWVFVAILIFSIGIYWLGLLDWHDDEKMGAFWGIVFLAFLWPVALALITVFGPFGGLYWLGDRKRKRKQKEESSKNK